MAEVRRKRNIPNLSSANTKQYCRKKQQAYPGGCKLHVDMRNIAKTVQLSNMAKQFRFVPNCFLLHRARGSRGPFSKAIDAFKECLKLHAGGVTFNASMHNPEFDVRVSHNPLYGGPFAPSEHSWVREDKQSFFVDNQFL